jgi:hypothetical protein
MPHWPFHPGEPIGNLFELGVPRHEPIEAWIEPDESPSDRWLITFSRRLGEELRNDDEDR